MKPIIPISGALCLLITTALLPGCATNPVTGRSEIVLVSVDQEKQLGAESAEQVKQQIGLIDNPPLLNYVETVGERLARFSPFQQIYYQFQIVDSPEANAFALPGGYIYISRGLLALTNSEAELAGVLGHEIGHVAARHSVQRLTRSAPVGIVTGITSLATSIISPALAESVAGAGGLLNSAMLAPYNRSQETDADAIGQELAAKAGYDPQGITRFLKTMERELVLRGQGGQSGSFLATHPANPERISATQQRVDELVQGPENPVAANRNAFLHKLDGLKLGADADHGVFIEQQFLHPKLNFGLTFPPGWKTENNPQFVVAMAPSEKAALLLQLQEKGNNTQQAAESFLQQSQLRNVPVNTLKIAGLPASRAIIKNNQQQAVITWIAHQDLIFRMTGISNSANTNDLQAFINSTATFHPLTPAQRAKIKQLRLRIVTARAGESVTELLKRVNSAWDESTCAIANNLEKQSVLSKGQLIKIAKSESYQ